MRNGRKHFVWKAEQGFHIFVYDRTVDFLLVILRSNWFGARKWSSTLEDVLSSFFWLSQRFSYI